MDEVDATPDEAFELGKVAGYDEAYAEIKHIFSEEFLKDKWLPAYLGSEDVARAGAVRNWLNGKSND